MPEYNLPRRQVLRTIGVGAGASMMTGVASANGRGRGNDCPDCPDGTRRLAKYEFDEGTGEFSFEKGACSDAVSDVSYTNKEGETSEPIEVEFTSLIFTDDVVVKYGPNCELASESDGVTFGMSDDKDSNGFEGRITVEDPKGPAISHFSLCAGVCFQVDFVFGEPIEDLSEDQYGGRKIAVRWDGTSVEKGQTSNSSPVTRDGGAVSTQAGIELSSDETEASVSFDATLGSDDVTLTLVSYTATCPPRFGGGGTAYLQDLYDYETVTYDGNQSGQTLTVALPGLDQLDELCDV